MKEQRLFCARDNFGIKPFYYYLTDNLFIFASEIRQIAEHPSVKLNLNEGILVEYLVDFHVSKDETHFVDINRLPPGYHMIVEPYKTRVKNYWQLKPQKRIWYKHDDEYVDHFLDIFGNAVQCRLHSNNKVGVYLSGGLDSSSIVGMAHYLNRTSKSSNIETFSLTFPGYVCDEVKFINAVIDKWGFPHHDIVVHNFNQVDWAYHINQTLEIPDPPNLTMMEPLMSEIASNNIHIMLSGIGGDELFCGSPFAYLDLLRKGEFKQFNNEFVFKSKIGVRNELVRITANLLWPMLPKYFRERVLQNKSTPTYPPWLSNRVVEQLRKKLNKINYKLDAVFENLSDWRIFFCLMTPWLAKALELNDRYNSKYHVENRYPYLDRRLVEFMLAIPEYERNRQDITKYILRKAGKYLLPKSVIKRTDKAEFSSAFVSALINSKNDKCMKLEEIIQYGFVSNEKILMEKFTQFFEVDIHKNNIELLWPLWFTFSINLLLTTLKTDTSNLYNQRYS